MSLSEPFVLFFIYILIAIILMILMICWAAKPTKQIQVSNTSRQSRFDSRVSSSKRDSLNAIHVPLKGSLNLSNPSIISKQLHQKYLQHKLCDAGFIYHHQPLAPIQNSTRYSATPPKQVAPDGIFSYKPYPTRSNISMPCSSSPYNIGFNTSITSPSLPYPIGFNTSLPCLSYATNNSSTCPYPPATTYPPVPRPITPYPSTQCPYPPISSQSTSTITQKPSNNIPYPTFSDSTAPYPSAPNL